MKEFIRPTKFKIILLIILLIATIFLPKFDKVCVPAYPPQQELICNQESVEGIGYPMFYGQQFSGDVGKTSFYPEMFVINLIVFYLISCLIVWIYKKAQKTEYPKSGN